MLSDVVGAQVEHYRDKVAGLTRAQLADRCRALGWPSLTATVIGYIEKGRPDADGRRRREVSVDELVALSIALDVPPLALLAPISDDPWGGSSPPRAFSTAEALAWFRGDHRILGGGPSPHAYAELRLYVQADDAARELYSLLGEWEGVPARPDWGSDEPQESRRPPGWDERYKAAIAQTRNLRAQLRSFGKPTPRLPVGLQWIDPAEPAPSHGDLGEAPTDADATGGGGHDG